jgi:predicted nucleic acid-binding protein
VSNQKQRKILLADFGSFHWLELNRAIFDDACELGATLRGHGTTVPATDLIIAASAIHSQATLYHMDDHFDRIAQHSDLLSVNLAQSQES